MTLVCPSCKQPFEPKPTQTSEYCSHNCRNYRYRANPALFWSRVSKGASDACWPWTGYCQKFGHGAMARRTVDGKRVTILAHRNAWELTNGPVPQGLFVLHHCDNPPCCNPAHLYLGTHRENGLDRKNRGRSRNQYTGPLA